MGERGRSHGPAFCDPLPGARCPLPVARCPIARLPDCQQFALSQYALLRYRKLEGHVQLARDLEVITELDFSAFARIVDVRKMLQGLLKRLKATPVRGNVSRAAGNG